VLTKNEDTDHVAVIRVGKDRDQKEKTALFRQ